MRFFDNLFALYGQRLFFSIHKYQVAVSQRHFFRGASDGIIQGAQIFSFLYGQEVAYA